MSGATAPTHPIPSYPTHAQPPPILLAPALNARRPRVRRQVRLVFATLERHFPERLHAIYLLDASRVFHAAWHLIKPFIDA